MVMIAATIIATTAAVVVATIGATTAAAVGVSAGRTIDDGQGLEAAAGGAAAAAQGQGVKIDGDEEITARRRAWLINYFLARQRLFRSHRRPRTQRQQTRKRPRTAWTTATAKARNGINGSCAHRVFCYALVDL
jgi:hypothetical protein